LRDVIFHFPRTFPADSVELELPDIEAATAMAAGRFGALDEILAIRREQLASIATGNDAEDLMLRSGKVIRIAYARLARRHGSWGNDFHAYHNEQHILEILGDRISRVIETHGAFALGMRDWCVLGLFAACHDLRQRESLQFAAGVGANERASIEEAFRLLDSNGFSRERDADIYRALDLTIAGSTFDGRPPPGGTAFNAAELVQSGGALAAKLDQKLDKHVSGWRSQTSLTHAHRLALIAADLDTANVAEPFSRFANSAANLCLEREMLCGRDLADAASAQPVLGFLTDGQIRFFFDLHRFNSEIGSSTFAAAKEKNAPKLRSLSLGLRARLAVRGMPKNGEEVLETYRATADELA
jgi:hypothetical protein